MTGPRRVILLACGSYNPPTNMHLRMFEIARDFLHRTTDFQVIAGLLSPVHDKYGKEDLVGANERIQMIQLAASTSQWLHVSEWETKQEDWTPTERVLQYHQRLIDSALRSWKSSKYSDVQRQRDLVDSSLNGNVDNSSKRQRLDSLPSWLNQLANSPDPVRIKLLCGADLLESFKKPGLWKEEDIETIVGKYGLIVITRTGSTDPYQVIYESDILTRLQRNIHVVNEWITNEVSSTKIRRALRRGESVKYVLQDSVIDFIYKHSLFLTHNNKYISGTLLTPSPNIDTDVLLPPPNSFTLAPPLSLHSAHHLGATLTRQHARQSSTPSDIEQDTPPGLSPADGPPSVLAPPVPPRLYPGLAVPVLQQPHPEVGLEPEAPKRNESLRHSPLPHYAPYASISAPTQARQSKIKDPHVDGLGHYNEHKEPQPILKSSAAKTHTALPERGRSVVKTVTDHSIKTTTTHPTLLKSRSISPKKGGNADVPAVHPNKRAFNTHVRSKSSVSLKPEKSFEGLRSSRDDVLLSLRDTYTRSLSTGSYIYDLLSRTRQVSPSHTEICLTHVPTKRSEKPIGPRGKNGDRLFTSRSLERPSTPRYERALSPSRKVVSLPISRGRSRERSPSPTRSDFRQSIERLREANITLPKMFGKDDLPRSLTHEEEINLIIAGDANLLRMNTPDSFPSLDVQSSESIVSNESEYEMRF